MGRCGREGTLYGDGTPRSIEPHTPTTALAFPMGLRSEPLIRSAARPQRKSFPGSHGMRRFRRRAWCRCRAHVPMPQRPVPRWRTCFEGPFGELIRSSGPMATNNPLRFSAKFQDDETGLLYYGCRYFTASTGRWLSRDPIEERGGDFLTTTSHAFVATTHRSASTASSPRRHTCRHRPSPGLPADSGHAARTRLPHSLLTFGQKKHRHHTPRERGQPVENSSISCYGFCHVVGGCFGYFVGCIARIINSLRLYLSLRIRRFQVQLLMGAPLSFSNLELPPSTLKSPL